MSANEAAYNDHVRNALIVAPDYGDSAVNSCTAGAAYAESILTLGIDINHSAGFKRSAVESFGSVHTHFLINRNNNFKGRMRNVVGIKKCQAIGNRYSIVSAKACSLGKNIFVVVGNS